MNSLFLKILSILVFFISLSFIPALAGEDVAAQIAAELTQGFASKEAALDNAPVYFSRIKPGILPADFFYFLDVSWEEISLFFSKEEGKIGKLQSYQKERLEELSALFLSEKIDDAAWKTGVGRLTKQSLRLSELTLKGTDTKQAVESIFADIFAQFAWSDHNLLYLKTEESHARAKALVQKALNEVTAESLHSLASISVEDISTGLKNVVARGRTVWRENAALLNKNGVFQNPFQRLTEISYLNVLIVQSSNDLPEERRKALMQVKDEQIALFLSSLKSYSEAGTVIDKFSSWLQNVDGNMPVLFLTLQDVAAFSEARKTDLPFESLRRTALVRVIEEYKGAPKEAYEYIRASLEYGSEYDLLLRLHEVAEMGEVLAPNSLLVKNLDDDIKRFIQDLKTEDEVFKSNVQQVALVHLIKEAEKRSILSQEKAKKMIDSLVKSMYDCTTKQTCTWDEVLSSDSQGISVFAQTVKSDYKDTYARWLSDVLAVAQKKYEKEIANVRSEPVFRFYEARFQDLRPVVSSESGQSIERSLEKQRAVLQKRREAEQKMQKLVDELLAENSEIKNLFKGGGGEALIASLKAHSEDYQDILAVISSEIKKKAAPSAGDAAERIRQGLNNPPASADTTKIMEELTALLNNAALGEKEKTFVEAFLYKLTENKVNVEGMKVLLSELSVFYETLSDEVKAGLEWLGKTKKIEPTEVEEIKIPKDASISE